MTTQPITSRVLRQETTSSSSPLSRQWGLLEQLSANPRGMTVKELVAASGVSDKTIRRDLALLSQLGFDVEEIVEKHGRKLWRIRHPFEAVSDRAERYRLIREAIRGVKTQVEGLGDALLAADLEALEWKMAKKCEDKKIKPR